MKRWTIGAITAAVVALATACTVPLPPPDQHGSPSTVSTPDALISATSIPAGTLPPTATVSLPSGWEITLLPATPPGDWRCPEVVKAAMEVGGWTAADLPTLDRLAYRESRCQTGAVSRTGDYGALQIHGPWVNWALCADALLRICDRSQLLNVHNNVAAAYLVKTVQGWRAWATY